MARVGPKQLDQPAAASDGQHARPVLIREHVLDHEHVDVDQGGLEYAQAQDGRFLLVTAVGGDVAALDDCSPPTAALLTRLRERTELCARSQLQESMRPAGS